jgi:hypothetical protein
MHARGALGFLFALTLTFVGSVEHGAYADPANDGEIVAAERAYLSLDYAAAIGHVDRAIALGALTHSALVRAYRVAAVSHAALEQFDAAKESFRKLLMIDPDYDLDRGLSPKIQMPYAEARGEWRAELEHPGMDVAPVIAPGEAGTLRITTRGFAGLVTHVVTGYRWGSAGQAVERSDAPQERIDAPLVAPPPGTSRLDFWVQAKDDREDVLFEVGNPATPKTTFLSPGPAVEPGPGLSPAPAEAPPRRGGIFSSPIFWTIASVVVVGAGAATYFALSKSNSSASLTPRIACANSPNDSCN